MTPDATDDLSLTCEWCGAKFPLSPDAFVENGYTMLDDDGLTQVSGVDLADVSDEWREKIKRAMGLDDKQIDELLTTGSVSTDTEIVCGACQEKFAHDHS